MRKVVALAQGKGGVGKSACSINLACQAVAAGKRAAIIDMDADQGTSLKWRSRRNGHDMPIVVRADASDLPDVLAKMKAEKVDWIFLDLPGRAAGILSAGLRIADFVLVPCRPLDVDIEASMSTIQATANIGKPYAYLMSIAPSQNDQKRARETAGFLRAHGHTVAPTVIVQRLIVPDAIRDGMGINEAKPDSESAAEFGELFKWLQKEVK